SSHRITRSLYCYTFFFKSSGPPPHLHSFPTRRSSDLDAHPARGGPVPARPGLERPNDAGGDHVGGYAVDRRRHAVVRLQPLEGRSEEHTSELQSRSDLVCRLLLEKKKKKTQLI